MLEKITKFHKYTVNKKYKMKKGDQRPDMSSFPEANVQGGKKSYPRFDRTRLNLVRESSDFFRLLDHRESKRQYSKTPVSFEELSSILKACRIVDPSRAPERRTYSSAGALFPIEIYAISHSVETLQPDMVFHFNVRSLALEKMWVVPRSFSREDVHTIHISNVATTLILTSVISRSSKKYREKAYPFSYFEAGLLAQNIQLAATQLGLGTCFVRGFIDEVVTDLLDLPADEIPMITITIGNIE